MNKVLETILVPNKAHSCEAKDISDSGFMDSVNNRQREFTKKEEMVVELKANENCS